MCCAPRLHIHWCFSCADDPYEEPTDAELVVDITRQTIPEIVHCKYSLMSAIRLLNCICIPAIMLMLEAAGLLG